MKTEAEVLGRIQEIIALELGKRVQEVESNRLPHKCVNNYHHPLDARKTTVGGEANTHYNRISGLNVIQSVGLCMLGSESPEDWSGTICDEPIDAKRCPLYNPIVTKDQVVSEFEKNLVNYEWVSTNLPEVYTLLWVLGESETRVSWWVKLLIRFFRSQPHITLPPFDPKKLLPSGS